MHAVFERCEYWRLRDVAGKPPGLMGWWPSRSVTFLENHDTGGLEMLMCMSGGLKVGCEWVGGWAVSMAHGEGGWRALVWQFGMAEGAQAWCCWRQPGRRFHIPTTQSSPPARPTPRRRQHAGPLALPAPRAGAGLRLHPPLPRHPHR